MANIDESLIEKLFDPWTFQIFYFSMYFTIALCVVGMGYHLSNKIRLPYKNYLLFEKLETHCGNIQLLVQTLQKNNDAKNPLLSKKALQNQKWFGLWNCENKKSIAEKEKYDQKRMKIDIKKAKKYAIDQCKQMTTVIKDIEQFWMQTIEMCDNNNNSSNNNSNENNMVNLETHETMKNINVSNNFSKKNEKTNLKINENIENFENNNSNEMKENMDVLLELNAGGTKNIQRRLSKIKNRHGNASQSIDESLIAEINDSENTEINNKNKNKNDIILQTINNNNININQSNHNKMEINTQIQTQTQTQTQLQIQTETQAEIETGYEMQMLSMPNSLSNKSSLGSMSDELLSDDKLIERILENEQRRKTSMKAWFENMYNLRGLLGPAIGEFTHI